MLNEGLRDYLIREYRFGRMTSEQVVDTFSKSFLCWKNYSVSNVLELGVHLGLALHCGQCGWGRRLGAEADLDAPGKCVAELNHSRQWNSN